MNVRTALASAADSAGAVCDKVLARRARGHTKPVLATWVGADAAIGRLFQKAGIPHYATETDAVRGFMHRVRLDEASRALLQCPPSMPDADAANVTVARRIVQAVLADGRNWLDPLEAADVLRA